MTVQFHRPVEGPTANEVADRQAFESLAAESLDGVRDAAAKWRDGLAVVGSLVIGAIVFKGREDLNKLATDWKVAVTVCLLLGLSALAGGLLLASSAASGQPTTITYAALRNQHGDVGGYRAALSVRGAKQFARARFLALAGLPLLVVAGLVLWWAPAAKDTAAVELISQNAGRVTTTCGKRLTAGPQTLRVDKQPAVRIDDIVLLRAVPKC